MGLSDVAGMLVLVSLALVAGVTLGLAGLALMSWLSRLLHLTAVGETGMATAHTGGHQP